MGRRAEAGALRGARWLPLVVAVLFSAVVFVRVKDCGLIGQDTYPVIRTSRVESIAELPGVLTQRLMTTHNFYRPVLVLSASLDHALWGLEPLGYQITNVLLFAACALGVGLLVRRLLGGAARAGPLAAVLVFALYPTHLEVVPVVARRPEVMVSLFTLLALWTQLSPKALGRGRPPVLPALFTLLAMGAKDNGIGLPPLCFLCVLLYSPRPTWRARFGHATVAMLPHVVLGTAFLSLRGTIVEGFGGHRSMDFGSVLVGAPRQLMAAFDGLIAPETLPDLTPSTRWLALVLCTTWIAVAVLGRAGPLGRTLDHSGRAALVGLVWIALFVLSYGARGVLRPWYTFPLVVGWAILLGAAAEALLGALRTRSPSLRSLGALGGVSLAALIVFHGSYSPVFHSYDELLAHSARKEAFYAEMKRAIDRAQPGSVVPCPPFPRPPSRPRSGQPHVRGLTGVTKVSLKAWAELVTSGLRIRTAHTSQARVRRPDELVLASDEIPIVPRSRGRR